MNLREKIEWIRDNPACEFDCNDCDTPMCQRKMAIEILAELDQPVSEFVKHCKDNYPMPCTLDAKCGVDFNYALDKLEEKERELNGKYDKVCKEGLEDMIRRDAPKIARILWRGLEDECNLTESLEAEVNVLKGATDEYIVMIREIRAELQAQAQAQTIEKQAQEIKHLKVKLEVDESDLEEPLIQDE